MAPVNHSNAIYLILLVGLFAPLSSYSQPTSRFQRQAVTNELATGLTGTGTSFNSYDTYPFQQQQLTGIQGYDDRLYNNLYNGYGDYTQYNQFDRQPAYGGLYDPTYGSAIGGSGAGVGWRGFGLGSKRYPYNRTKFGVKY